MPETVGVICSAGECTDVDPVTALVLIALESLATELSKKEPFGANNEIVKTLRNAQRDLTQGRGDNNDIVKVLRNAWSDLSKGLGSNNDLRKALEALGIKV